MSATKATSKKPASKKAVPTHPSFIDMIAEVIANDKENARTGVSRPQIKKFIETKYKLPSTAAVNTQISKALERGTEIGKFVMPKGALAVGRSGWSSVPDALSQVPPARSSSLPRSRPPTRRTRSPRLLPPRRHLSQRSP
ncbi:hypothetical protein CALVIDRAFT_538351 [Calocera viscosa TUFC12733]|uniref:Histone H1 n=1 Tax=Calocera viscosa (strain TUFC12733) TaxID=1330018 RepID=A0A167L0I0_CALVF|nr:hypothetical protein CALVIDRAFT_538351 [Calocera viscosa TUFC12733]